jgi:hypothetical protein
MKIIITENQLKKIITEQLKQKTLNESFLSNILSDLGSWAKKIVDKFKGKTPSKKELDKEIERAAKSGDYKKPSRDKIVGTDLGSCKKYKEKGGLSAFSNFVKIDKSNSNFTVNYKGPSSGKDICHASNGKDTLHQIFSLLICEINPYLYDEMLKPNINKITVNVSKKTKQEYSLSIDVPLEKSDIVYQLNRRGGWGHKDGKDIMSRECEKNLNCEGPKTYVFKIEGLNDITEYFISYSI